MNEAQCRGLVSQRSGGLCEARLGGRDALSCRGVGESMHHRRKRSQGGLWTPSNVVHVCGDGTTGCHGYIEANPVQARRARLWLYAGMDSLTTPAHMIFRGMRGWYLLDDEGSCTWLSEPALARMVRA